MFVFKTVLVLVLCLSFGLAATTSNTLSVCELSKEARCGLMTIGLKDICDCLASKGICFQEIRKIKTTFAPFCRNMHSFRENCMRQLPCRESGGSDSGTTHRIQPPESATMQHTVKHVLKQAKQTRPQTHEQQQLSRSSAFPTTELALMTTPESNITAQRAALARLRKFSDEAEPNNPGLIQGLLTEFLRRQDDQVSDEQVKKDPLTLELEAEKNKDDARGEGKALLEKINDFLG